MAGTTYSNLTTDIRNYTEVDDSVFTQAVINRFIEDAEFRINQELPMDAARYVSEGTLVADDNTINSPGKGSKGATGALFIRGVEVFNSTANTQGKGTWLEKKDQTYLSEYVDRLTGSEGDLLQFKMLQDSLSIMPCLVALREILILLQEAFI